MSEQALIVRDDAKLAVQFTPEAIAMRDSALEVAALVGKVTNAAEQEEAVKAQTEIQRVRQLAEKARVACKAPVLAFGNKIDSAAKEFVAELNVEMMRVSALVSDFQQLEAMKARAAERAQRDELDRLEREKNDALAKAKSHEAADAIQEHFNNKAAEQIAAPISAPARATGQVVKSDWEITVTNPYELAKFHPACVNISPRLSEIKQLLNEGVTVKGVTARKVMKSDVRVGRVPQLIDV